MVFEAHESTAAWTALVERESDLEMLSGLARSVPRGRPQLVLVTGEIGSGKTALVEHFLSCLPDTWRIHRVAAPGPTVLELFEESLASGPTAIVVEDVHHLEANAVASLRSSLDRVTGPILILATYRAGAHPLGSEVSRGVAELLRHPSAVELRLRPLSVDGVSALAGAVGGRAVDEATAFGLHARSGGNPFFVQECVSADHGVPWRVAASVFDVLRPFPTSVLRLARLLAVAGTAVDPTVIETVIEDADDAVVALVESGFGVRSSDGSLALRHRVVGECLLEHMPVSQRRALHRSLATALDIRGGAAPERLAQLWEAADDPARAAAWSVVAADDQAGRRLFRSAVELYGKALTRRPADAEEHGALLERAAAAAVTAGLVDQGGQWAEEAARLYGEAGQPDRACRVRDHAALRYLPGSSTTAGDGGRSPVAEARAARRAGDLDDAARRLRQTLLEVDDPSTRMGLAFELVQAGDAVGGLAIIEAVGDAAAATGDLILLTRALANLARIHSALGDLGRATSFYREAVSTARREPEALYWPLVQSGLAVALALKGDVADAERSALDVAAVDNPLFQRFGDLALAVVDLERGDIAGARRRVDALLAVRGFTHLEFLVVPVLTVAARVELADGHPAGALARLGEAETLVAGAFFEDQRPDRVLLQAQAASALEAIDELRSLADDARAMAERPGAGGGLTAVSSYIEGLVGRLSGHAAEATARFVDAAGMWLRVGRVSLAAASLCDAAEMARVSEPERATAYAARAHTIAAGAGLVAIADRADELRSRPETSMGPLARLTARELEIIRLVAAGRTNREIAEQLYVSSRTVGNHLGNIFTKLEISRRSEAAGIVARHLPA